MGSRARRIAGVVGIGAALVGCAGEGAECHTDEAADLATGAVDLGDLDPRPLHFPRSLDAIGVLQTEDDLDWYTFSVKDPWLWRWHPRVRLDVLKAAGSGHNRESFRVSIFAHDGSFVGDLDGLSDRLRGSPFFDDGLPYYVRIAWAEAPVEVSPAPFVPPGEATSTPTPAEASPDATSTPTSTPTGDASPAPTSATCTRYHLMILP